MIAALAAMASCGNAKAEASEEEAMADDNVAAYVDPDNEKLPFEIRDNVIFNENVPVVVDFYADWCKPCKAYAPIFHEVAEKYGNAACFVSLNTEEYPNLCETYQITAIPATVFIMPGGSLLGKEEGILSAERLQSLVDQLVATSAGIDMEV